MIYDHASTKLAAVTASWEGRNIRILDEVDCISSVSGGSFTAAYYALYGDNIFKEFGDKFLYRNIQRELILKAVNPLNWGRLASPYFSRSDLASELYDQTIFDKKTFGDLRARNQRPFLILNATHLQPGARFQFTQDQFDYVGSNLMDFPIGRAVAASSAFPFLLSPISLKNFPDAEGSPSPPSKEDFQEHYHLNRRLYEWAKQRSSYGDKDAHPYVHLMDGGLADNIGLRAITDEYRRGFIRKRINTEKIDKLVIIAANARTAPPEDLDKHRHPPGLVDVALKTATISMENYSFDTVEMTRELTEQRAQSQRELENCQSNINARCPGSPALPPLAGRNLRSYVIELNFEGIENPQEQECFLSLPTSYSLSHQQVIALINIAGELLETHPKFKELLQDLGAKSEPVGARAKTTHCQQNS